MKKIVFYAVLTCIIPLFALQQAYTKHQVSKGETLYSIARFYDISVELIKSANKNTDVTNLKIGQVINIPISNSTTTSTSVETTSSTNKITTSTNSTKTHKILQGETLYGIAKKYGVTLSQLQSWNPGLGTVAKIGQIIIVYAPTKPSTNTPVTQTNNSVTQPKYQDEDVTDPTRNMNSTSKVEPKTTSSTTNTNNVVSTNSTEKLYNGTTTTNRLEKGIGMKMASSDENTSYIALYSNAPIGSIISVKNLMNGKVITAKVVGRIPNLDRNKDVLVKISSNAYEALGALDEKFLIEVRY